MDVSRALDAIRRTLTTGLASAAAASGRGLVGVAAGACIGTFAGLVVGGSLFGLVARREPLRVSRVEAGALLRASRSIALLRPLGVAERTMDRIVVGAILGPSLVAVVEVATQVANGAAAILSASAYSVVPAASWLHARDDSPGLRALLDRGTRFSIAVTLPVIVIAATVSGPALRLWVGSDAALTATLLALASIAMVVPLQVGSELLVGTNRAGLVLRAAGGALVVNLAATAAFVHFIGVPGAFLGTITANLLLIPLLAGAFLAEVAEQPVEFARRSVLPVALPLLGLTAAAVTVSLLPLPDLEKTALSAAAGALAYGVALTLASARRGRPIPRLVQLLSQR